VVSRSVEVMVDAVPMVFSFDIDELSRFAGWCLSQQYDDTTLRRVR
jgi:hypothetical protein